MEHVPAFKRVCVRIRPGAEILASQNLTTCQIVNPRKRWVVGVGFWRYTKGICKDSRFHSCKDVNGLGLLEINNPTEPARKHAKHQQVLDRYIRLALEVCQHHYLIHNLFGSWWLAKKHEREIVQIMFRFKWASLCPSLQRVPYPKRFRDFMTMFHSQKVSSLLVSGQQIRCDLCWQTHKCAAQPRSRWFMTMVFASKDPWRETHSLVIPSPCALGMASFIPWGVFFCKHR